ncbi:MAG: hypothetical protein WC451_03385 [Patescibacteria group bacterium]
MGKFESAKIHIDGEISSLIFYGSNNDSAYRAAIDYAKVCEISSFDIIEIEPEEGEANSKGEIKIKAIRELIRQLSLTPGHGLLKLAIIKDADKLSLEAANTLLKILEEPPKSVKIILLSANLKLLSTIRSRCQVVRLEDKESIEQESLMENFRLASEGDLKNSFKTAEKISAGSNLEKDLDSLISMLRKQMLQTGSAIESKKIRLLIDAKKTLKMTTNKRLIMENLFLQLHPVKSDEVGLQGKI